MHIVKKPKTAKRGRSLAQLLAVLGVKPTELNTKPAYSLWFAAGLYRHLKGKSYVKVQRTIVQA